MTSNSLTALFIFAVLHVPYCQGQERRPTSRNFTPDDVAEFHDKKFKKFASTVPGKRVENYERDFLRILCEDEDEDEESCSSSVVWARELVERYLDEHGFEEYELPTFWTSGLGSSFESVRTSISGLNENNLEETLEDLAKIKGEIEGTRTFFGAERKRASTAVAVAIKSAEWWHKVMYDETNPMFGLLPSRERHENRNLQVDWGSWIDPCFNALPIIIWMDLTGVLITPVAFFVGTPAAYVTWFAYAPFFLYNSLINQQGDSPFNILAYAVLPLTFPFAAIGSPTVYMSFLAFRYVVADCASQPTPAPVVG